MPQSLSFVLVHLVFSTKNRDPFIRPEDEPRLYSYLGGIARDCRSPAYTVGGTEDHVHLLCNLSRTLTVANLLEELKSRSSKWVKTLAGSYNDFHWQHGYGAFSIGHSQENVLRAYIAAQKEHHRKRTFQDEFRELLDKYEVDYDERYVWD